MCMNCQKKSAPCDILPFEDMKIIERYEMNGQEFRVVKCNDFEKSDQMISSFDVPTQVK